MKECDKPRCRNIKTEREEAIRRYRELDKRMDNVLTHMENAREGFANALMIAISNEDKIAQRVFEAQHLHFDNLVVEFGGESEIQ